MVQYRYNTPGLRYDSGIRYDDANPVVNELTDIIMRKVKLSLAQKDAAQKVGQGNTIKTAMTNNTNFNTPNPPLPGFGTVITNLSTKKAAYDTLVESIKMAKDDLEEAEATYDLNVTQLAAYAENVTAGDGVKLESGGFELRALPVPVGQLGQVQGLKVKASIFPGELKAIWKGLRGAKSYEVQYSLDPFSDSTWKSAESVTMNRTEIDSLVSGSKIWVRVRGIGKSPAGPWCEPVCRIVP